MRTTDRFPLSGGVVTADPDRPNDEGGKRRECAETGHFVESVAATCCGTTVGSNEFKIGSLLRDATLCEFAAC
jgi:hypothetical protein